MIRLLKKESLKIAATTWKAKMKHLITAAGMFLLASSAAQSQEPNLGYWASKPIQCTTAAQMVPMMKRFGENPLIYMDGKVKMPDGTESTVKIVLAQNPKTHTWTLLEFTEAKPGEETDPNEQVCILAYGKGMINFNLPEVGTQT